MVDRKLPGLQKISVCNGCSVIHICMSLNTREHATIIYSGESMLLEKGGGGILKQKLSFGRRICMCVALFEKKGYKANLNCKYHFW